jgi:hypothetical protein
MEDLGMHSVSAKFVPTLMIRNSNNFPSAKISSKEQMTMKIFCKISLPVTRCGFTVMTLKPNNSPDTGRLLLHLTPRKHDRCAHK